MDRKQHWEEVYRSKDPLEVSWYQRRPELSLKLIEASGVGPEARIIDVGGGASTLVDELLQRGYRNLSVLDISAAALAHARGRLGDQAAQVNWLEADVTRFEAPQAYELWHDRAVFHFLTEAEERKRYVANASRALRPGAHLIIATFAPDGPKMCSGLNIVRYSPEALQAELGEAFQLIETDSEVHMTPAQKSQHFTYCRFQYR